MDFCHVSRRPRDLFGGVRPVPVAAAKAPWTMSSSKAVREAMSLEYLAYEGLSSPLTIWQTLPAKDLNARCGPPHWVMWDGLSRKADPYPDLCSPLRAVVSFQASCLREHPRPAAYLALRPQNRWPCQSARRFGSGSWSPRSQTETKTRILANSGAL